ncbi:hypothetical protein FW796_06630 [Pseudomonas sp. 910_21]
MKFDTVARSGIAPGARRQPAIHGRVAASSASLPSCPLRNAYARPAGKGPEDQDQDQDQKPEPSAFYALSVGAGLPAKGPVRHASPGRTPSLASQLLHGGRYTPLQPQAGRQAAVALLILILT